jgi:hypothetical protein
MYPDYGRMSDDAKFKKNGNYSVTQRYKSPKLVPKKFVIKMYFFPSNHYHSIGSLLLEVGLPERPPEIYISLTLRVPIIWFRLRNPYRQSTIMDMIRQGSLKSPYMTSSLGK